MTVRATKSGLAFEIVASDNPEFASIDKILARA